MIIHRVTIEAAPDNNPTDVRRYTWREGDPPEELVSALNNAAPHIMALTEPLHVATNAQKPIEL